MHGLEVTLDKLRRYVQRNPAYMLKKSNGYIVLIFSPKLADIEAHLGESPVIELSGTTSGSKVKFTKMLLNDAKGKRDFDIEEASASFSAWLEDIETRY